jgi:putative transposase
MLINGSFDSCLTVDVATGPFLRLLEGGSTFLTILVHLSGDQNVIAIDMGIKHIATSVELATNRTVFYGKDLNHVRGWYFWLRPQLGLKKAIDAIKKIGDHEKRIANDIIHKITREIVNQAIEADSLIVLGKLKGLRNQDKKNGGRRRKFNRKLSGFPYSKFTEYLTYKATLAGIKVIKIFENWT